ncbi:MAG: glycosyltransferase family 2 protein [Tissierellia bacterium]|nr:glycosyltransferase family 2 protein [Tissierellia bacterium]
MKLVSIIMPTYKRDLQYVRRALVSLIDQSYQNIEIIVVDDSPDDYIHRDEVKNFVQNIDDDRIIYIQNKENLGGSLARNEGIFRSSGEYITFLDDDDKYKVDKIKNQVEFMEENDYDMSFSNMLIVDTKDNPIDLRNYTNIWSFEQEEFLKYHIMRHATGTPTFMYKASKLKEIGGFDNAIMGQEFYLMLKSIESGFNIGYLDKTDVIVYRHKGEAISTGINKIRGEKILYEKKKEYFELLNHRQRRFVRMRHYAVLAVAYKRNKKYLGFLFYSLVSFLSAPIACLDEAYKYIKTYTKMNK